MTEVKLQLKYRPGIPEEAFLGHVMGPDAWGAYYYGIAVMHTETHTVVNLHPLSPDETRLIKDEWGQVKVTF